MTKTAYDDILDYSSAKQFGDFRRVLIGNRGTIASGNLAKGLTLLFDKNQPQQNETLFEEENQEQRSPINIVQKIGSYGQPGLIFNKNGYEEVLRQIESRGELTLSSLIDKFKFAKDADAIIWDEASDTVKRRCVSRNLDKLIKETQIQYRIHGDRMHYLTVGLVEIETYQGKTERYPLFMFSCPDLDLNKMTAQVDSTGFVNFWLDKNIFENEIAKKRDDNFEVTLDNNFANEVNTISQYMNGVNLAAKYKSIKVDPSYMAFQIVSGFEAEYVDPVWTEILKSGNDNE
jgi:hypothetical protein